MNFRKVNKKIKTISNVKKITKAMQMVSAVKMKKAQMKAIENKPYTDTLEFILNKVLKSYSIEKQNIPWYQIKHSGSKVCNVIISSDKGLCGTFNFNLFKYLTQECNFSQDSFISVGKKSSLFILKMGGDILAEYSHLTEKSNIVSAIFSQIKEIFISGKCNRVNLIYTEFESTFKSYPKKQKLLPFDIIFNNRSLQKDKNEEVIDYLIEPLTTDLINSLIEDLMTQSLRKAIVQSYAAEQSARMMAMKNATDNAQDIIESMTLLANKLRQTSITNELLEMTSAKESSKVN